ncbi:hypothetical protein [Actinoplanes couchii]|uniref:Integral membrane protein n=1 Tax=Actinoplanes couchii TaxID=403638 RepID=A0ABQ3XR72_9ACTN|nr:hypothetical protein [Actinoplanes couchii]MDR6317366.1 hypothetical protein [Actinoplanes couchii]GID60900.1 hypothetical protein Aco03nite_093040 [Actinoplanes couchii]
MRDRIGRALMGLDAVFTVVAVVNGFTLMAVATDETIIVEGWRTFGFIVFVGLWALIAVWPRRVPGVWELILIHKVLVTGLALTVLDSASGAAETAWIDGWLVISTAVAYVLCRGWQAWRRPADTA